jgi:aspartate aminotransferase-like enzyme
MMKYYLMAPGPSMIPERVLLEMAKPIIHHRTQAFEKVLSDVRSGLKSVFQTKNEVVLHASVGSGAMESAVVNCFSPGDKVIVVRSGKFGERWAEQSKKYGLNVVNFDVPWGEAADLEQMKTLLAANSDARAFMSQACETSTGVYHPVEQMAKLVHSLPNCLMMIDAITALGTIEIKTDAWGLDVVVTGSQKAFMLPPGLSMITLSDKALKATESAKLPRYYFDVLEEIKCLKKNQTRFTPPISLIQGLRVALEMMHEETLPMLFARHKRLSRATREAVIAMGLELFAKSAPSDSITSVIAPSGINGDAVVEKMQSKYGFTIIGGQDHVKGKIFRLGHMGYCGDFDVVSMIAALEMTLSDLGFKVEMGRGVARATQIIHEELNA